jgi:hypothetical protein
MNKAHESGNLPSGVPAGKVATARFLPSGIVCLTEETVATLYLLGEQNRIVACRN